jgi:hypothetical protein
MKKSAIYHAAMLSIMDDERLDSNARLEIISVLLRDKEVAEFTEKKEAEAQAEADNW